jgi:hypothetical protein
MGCMRISRYSHVTAPCLVNPSGTKLMHDCEVFGLAIVGTNTYLSRQEGISPRDNSD